MNNFIIHPNYVEVLIESPKYGQKSLLIDLCDLNLIKDYNWHLKPENNGNFYAHTNFWKNNKRTGGSIHRMIVPEYKMVDHIDGNGLNNCRSNLRSTNYQLNNKNKTKRKNCKSKFKGVHLRKNNNKWIAVICVNYKKIYLGDFKNEIDAAKAYNKEAVKHEGFSLNKLE